MRRSVRRKPARPSCICTPATQKREPDQTPEAFAPFLRTIKQRSNCVINITTGGSPAMSVEERLKPAATFKPEVAIAQHGSMNPDSTPCWSATANSSTNGAALISRDHVTASSGTPSRTSRTSSRLARGTARGSRSNAMISVTFTRWPISSIASSSGRRCSCRACSAFSADRSHPEDVMHMSERRPAVRRRLNVLGLCPGRRPPRRCRSRRWPCRWAGTCASDLRNSLWIGPGRSRSRAMPTRSPWPARSSNASASRSLRLGRSPVHARSQGRRSHRLQSTAASRKSALPRLMPRPIIAALWQAQLPERRAVELPEPVTGNLPWRHGGSLDGALVDNSPRTGRTRRSASGQGAGRRDGDRPRPA